MSANRPTKRAREMANQLYAVKRSIVRANVGLGSGTYAPKPQSHDLVKVTARACYSGSSAARFSDPIGGAFKAKRISSKPLTCSRWASK